MQERELDASRKVKAGGQVWWRNEFARAGSGGCKRGICVVVQSAQRRGASGAGTVPTVRVHRKEQFLNVKHKEVCKYGSSLRFIEMSGFGWKFEMKCVIWIVPVVVM